MSNRIKFLYHDEELQHKPSGQEIAKWGKYWSSRTATIREFINDILKKHRAFSIAYCSENRRIEENFVSCQIIGIDMDSGLQKNEVKKLLKKHKINYSLIYNSPSWKADYEKYRIIWFLKEPCTNPHEIREVISELMFLLNHEADKKCKDPVRYFNPPINEEGKEGIELYNKTNIERNFIEIGKIHKIAEKAGYTKITYNSDETRKLGEMPIINSTMEDIMKECRAIRDIMKCDTKSINEWSHSYFIVETLAPTLNRIQDNKKYRGRRSTSLLNEFKKALNNVIASGIVKIGNNDLREYNKPNKKHCETDSISRRISGNKPPCNCTDDCPYYKQEGCCLKEYEHSNLYRAQEGRVNSIIQYRNINRNKQNLFEARDKLNVLSKDILRNNCGFNIIKASTGTGKSTNINEIVNNTKDVYFIVLPDHKLSEDDNYNKFPKIPLNPIASYKDEDEEMEKDIRRIYNEYKVKSQVSALEPNKAMNILKYKLEEINKSELYKEYEKYIKDKNEILKERIIVTTHARYAIEGKRLIDKVASCDKKNNGKIKYYNKYFKNSNSIKIIIDEDIINKFTYIHTIENKNVFMKKLRKIAQIDIKLGSFTNAQIIENKIRITLGNLIAKRISEIQSALKIDDGEVIHLSKISDLDNINEVLRETIYTEEIPLSDKELAILMKADFVTKDRGKLSFLINKTIPQHYMYNDKRVKLNTVMFTATPTSSSLIEHIIPNYKMYDVGKVKPKDDFSIQINQKFNVSRNGLRKNYDKSIEEIKTMIGDWSQEELDKTLLITYRDYEEKAKFDLGLNQSLHIWNLEGFNEYKGFNIIWLGSPYPPASYIRLLGEKIGITDSVEYNMIQNKKPSLIDFDNMNVKISNFRTYRNKKLREIQLAFMSKEIVQGLGRSRFFDPHLESTPKAIVLSNVDVLNFI
ncbi:hypothetical protein [Clostridium sp. YIM B02555]|uniref:hypothetical protein n=1 Tax=Clostridium sp. YIM B02555 TaxID=2911968 RepID=UPI001EEF5837|nr:hypothetical protein [Clostridium sp. YIM B02555]